MSIKSTFIVMGLLTATLAPACSAGDGADIDGQRGGAATAISTSEGGAGGGVGATSTTTTTTSTVSAPPPPAWGPPSWSSCLPHGIVTTCAEYCASYNLSCATACTSPYTGKPVGALTFNNATCTSFMPGGTACDADIYTSQSTRCCCGI